MKEITLFLKIYKTAVGQTDLDRKRNNAVSQLTEGGGDDEAEEEELAGGGNVSLAPVAVLVQGLALESTQGLCRRTADGGVCRSRH